MPFDLAESYIHTAEQLLGATLPDSYRLSMLKRNGGELELEDDVWQQYPIADTSDRKRISRTANHIIKETQHFKSWPGFPKEAVAIAGNGSGDQLVLLKEGTSFGQEIYIWAHETGELQKIAHNFSALTAL
ncbi:SMI1/KNR4 family protein [Rheinheimera hassiensis]|uniref:SMI1/KNR4 family protein n=1 Tax=Rheinheimera hassiensis TaxID=1193627 RepID=UPI001F0611E4|nr:SMI1/KNR4 family protein [Rheinheimera hassiensis]